MRKITKEVVGAFLRGEDMRKDNTESRGGNLYLFGNRIAVRHPGELQICLAGWNTDTTRERLNAIPGVSLSTRRGVLYLNGNVINEFDWYTIHA